MTWRVLTVVLLGAAVAGCRPEPPPPAPTTAEVQRNIVAIEPRDGARDVLLTPVLKWKLPPALGNPQIVSVGLFDLGRGAEPPKPAEEGKEVAFASGLGDVTPTALDLFHEPPSGVVLTGELRDMEVGARKLKPDTWYRWRVRAQGENNSVLRADFVFRTYAASPGK